MHKKLFILGFAVVPVFLLGVLAGFYGIHFTSAFEGPPVGTVGSGSGAISSDSSNNLSIGTTTVLSDTRLYIKGANSATDKYAIQLKNAEGRPLFVLRNDGRVVMGPFPAGNLPAFPSASTLLVRGLIETVNSTSPNLGGGVKFPDGTIQTTAGAATITAANVSQGNFGENSSGGNYSFPASLSIGTSAANGALNIGTSGGMITFSGTAGGGGSGIQYLDSGSVARQALNFPGSNVVALSNRATNGTVQLRANTATAGSGGEVIALVAEDDEIHLLPSGGNVGIGTATPSSKLTLSNNVATGFLDTYSKYQTLFHTGVSAGASYGIGIKAHTFILNSGSGGFNFDRAGSATLLSIATSGLVTASNRITGISTPTDSSDAATKGYVDSLAAVSYQGRTSATYNGNLGGIAGANAKCQVNYAGSHMCTQGELLKSGATTFGGTGWVGCDLAHVDNCDGVLSSFTSPTAAMSCTQFTNAIASVNGPVASSNGSLSFSACNTSNAIHCCK